MRVQDAEQGVGQFREVVLELGPGAGVEVGERLDEPLDVRVLAGVRAEAQASGDLRVGLGELGPEPADVGQLAVVERQQLVGHRPAPGGLSPEGAA